MEFALAHNHGEACPQERRSQTECMCERTRRVPRRGIPTDEKQSTGSGEDETEPPGRGKLLAANNDTNERDE
jgi:hypothetical protein